MSAYKNNVRYILSAAHSFAGDSTLSEDTSDYRIRIGFVDFDYVVVREGNQRTLESNTLDKLLDHGAGVMFRKKYLESIGLYDEKYKNCEDFDLLLRYMKNFDGFKLRS